MAKTEKPDAAAQARAEIGNRPRQSVVRFVEHFRTIREAAPDRLEELFGDQIPALEAVADKVKSPIQTAIDKVAEQQVAISVKALTNTDPLNGYAGYRFNEEVFAEKTREKKPRVVKSKVEKAKDLLEGISPEELEELQALLAARGHAE